MGEDGKNEFENPHIFLREVQPTNFFSCIYEFQNS